MDKVRISRWMAAATVLACSIMLGVPWAVERSKPTERAVQVQVCRVEMGDVERVIALTGVVRFENEYAAVSPGNGRVSAVYVKPGERVSKGQALFRLDDTVQAAAVSSALQRSTLPEALPAAVYGVEGLGAAVNAEFDQTVRTAAAALDSLTVRAEADGLVQQVMVTSQGAAAVGMPGVVISGEQQEIQCQAVVRDAAQIQVGMQARMLDGDHVLCRAVVTSVGAAEAVNGQSLCPVTLRPETNIALPMGAAVDVEIICASAEGVPVLPVGAVDEHNRVRWIADGRSYETAVSVLLADERRCWVDLPVGTKVVLQGGKTLMGQRIREVQE